MSLLTSAATNLEFTSSSLSPAAKRVMLGCHVMRNPLSALVEQCPPGWTLPGEFFTQDTIHQMDLATVWRTGWLLAGHACEIPNPGDYFTLELEPDSILIVRGDDGSVRALHNVCRHRGSLLCDAAAGHVNRLVCPYHQWT